MERTQHWERQDCDWERLEVAAEGAKKNLQETISLKQEWKPRFPCVTINLLSTNICNVYWPTCLIFYCWSVWMISITYCCQFSITLSNRALYCGLEGSKAAAESDRLQYGVHGGRRFFQLVFLSNPRKICH